MNSNSTNSSFSFAADEEGLDIEESDSSMNSYRLAKEKDMNKLTDELQKLKSEMSTLKNEGKNAVQSSSAAFSEPSNSSNLNATMNQFGIEKNTDAQSKEEGKEQLKNNERVHLMQNEERMDKLGTEAKNDGTMGKAPIKMKCQYEEQDEVDKSGMEALNDETPKGFGLFHRTKAPTKLNFQDESEKETENEDKLDEPKFNYKYVAWGTFAFFVFILLPFCIVIIRGSDSAIAGMKNKLSDLDMELEDNAKLLSNKIIDLEDARKYNEKLAKELEEKNKKNEALEKMRSKELAKIAEIQTLEAKIHSDLQIKPLSGSLDLILPLHMLTAPKFNITSLKIVVANFQWWASVSDKWDPTHLGILVHLRPPNGYNGPFNVRGEVNFTLKHVLPSPDCGFFVCNKDFQVRTNFRINLDYGFCIQKFAEIKQIINPNNGFVTLENNLHLNVAFRLTESTIDHYSIKQ